jgi:hypothetical protein
MAKPAKRRRARQTAKLHSHALQAAGSDLVEQDPAPLRRAERISVEGPLGDIPDDGLAQDAWLLEREAEDIQRDGERRLADEL